MSWLQFLGVVRSRWKTLLAIYLGIVALVVGVSLVLPKRYTAETQVLIDMKPDPIAGVVWPSMLTPGYMVTQVDIVKSMRLATMVVDRLGITRDPAAIERFQDDRGGQGSIRQYYALLLQEDLEVKPSRESSVLTITFTGSDPGFAAMVANAFAQAYVDTGTAMRVEPARQQRRLFEEQAVVLRQRLEEAQGRLGDYQRTNAIVSADERMDVETAKLQEMSSHFNVLQLDATQARERMRQAERLVASGGLGELPEVLQNPLVQQLKGNLAALEVRLDERLSVLGAAHPEVQRMHEERASLAERLDREVRTVAASQSRASALADRRLADQQRALDGQRRRVLALKAGRDRLTALQRDVDNAQGAYEAVAQRLSQSGLESQSAQANLFVLQAAEAPNEHSSPLLLVNTLVAGVLGLALSAAAALALELLQRRIRSSEDLMQAVAAPLIGRLRHVGDLIGAAPAPRVAGGALPYGDPLDARGRLA